ncbi:MAG: hypothetical protein KDK36_08325 [Leptospiraceae bacterium]|nr:hypothetical protein [Leptospiraceae bacterium]
MKLHCETCKKLILSPYINLDSLVAKCTSCNESFSFKEKLEPTDPFKTPTIQSKRLRLPDGIKFKKRPNKIEITFSWFKWKTLLFFGFSIYWVFQHFTDFVNFFTHFNVDYGFPAFFYSFYGLFFIYLSLTGFINKTKIVVKRDDLVIKVGPIPAKGNRKLDVREFEQLYCKSEEKDFWIAKFVEYQVFAVMRDYTHELIVDGLAEKEQAQYIEHEIEKFLRIIDEKVEGEEKK